MPSIEERFWSKVEKQDSCWLWKASCLNFGYGSFNGSSAHRFSYKLHHGNIPNGLFVLHRCNVPSCVNPKHLYIGTQSDNMKDKMRVGHDAGTFKPMGKHPNSKLNLPKIDEIKRLRTHGITQKEISKKLGVCQPEISKILNGKRWIKRRKYVSTLVFK